MFYINLIAVYLTHDTQSPARDKSA